jgi:hypothetical protein
MNHNLNGSAGITQIDERNAAMISSTSNPASKCYLCAGIGGA